MLILHNFFWNYESRVKLTPPAPSRKKKKFKKYSFPKIKGKLTHSLTDNGKCDS